MGSDPLAKALHAAAGKRWQQIGLTCRWLDGAVRQQCAGHPPFEREATVDGGFSTLPTGTTDPELTFVVLNLLR
jgi:hypothetical protein